MHVKKICDKIAPLESKSIQILIENDKILDNFTKLEINPKLIEAYTRIYNELALSKDRECCEFLDEEEDEPPTNYGDQSYDQRTCIYVLNRETLEIEYNMTQMNFFNSNFFNNMPDFNNAGQGTNSRNSVKEKELNKRSMTEFDLNPRQSNPFDQKKITNRTELMSQMRK